MMTYSRTVKVFVMLGLLASLAACDMMESKHAQNGLPDKWWSDNYYAMLGNQQTQQATSIVRPKPLKLQ